MVPLKSLPTIHRPRERLSREGAPTLSVEDLIAVLIRTGSRSSDVLELSRRVADSLLLGQDSAHDLAAIPGMGLSKASSIAAALALPAALEQRSQSFLLTDPTKIYEACTDIVSQAQEHLVVFFLTVHNRQIARETISIGTVSASLVHPREVYRPAILHNASHIVLAHNHPSGNREPSLADKQATIQIAQAGRQLGIELIDHVICSNSGYTSLKAGFPELFF